MLRHAIVLLLLSTAALAATHRATWVWDNDVLEAPASRAELLRFCAQRRIDVIFLHTSAGALTDRGEQFRAFLAAAHARQMQVEALGGAPEWTQHRAELEGFVAAVVAFNQAAAPEERFDGIHLDVEPYSTPEWDSSRETTVQQWLTMFDQARSGAAGLPVAADVPTWFSNVNVGDDDLLSALLSRVDGVTLMAYGSQHRKESLAAACRRAQTVATATGKHIWVGVSVQSRYLARASQRSAERLIKHSEQALGDAPAVNGVAIHDYAHLRALYPNAR
jgi:hypothetical protein